MADLDGVSNRAVTERIFRRDPTYAFLIRAAFVLIIRVGTSSLVCQFGAVSIAMNSETRVISQAIVTRSAARLEPKRRISTRYEALV
jgi:hypothetical protein